MPDLLVNAGEADGILGARPIGDPGEQQLAKNAEIVSHGPGLKLVGDPYPGCRVETTGARHALGKTLKQPCAVRCRKRHRQSGASFCEPGKPLGIFDFRQHVSEDGAGLAMSNGLRSSFWQRERIVGRSRPG